MLGQKVLPAILLLLPATFALTVHTTVVEAASTECKAKPDSAAPAGSRWYYRANRVDHSRCWFLSSRNVSVHSRLRQTTSVTSGHFIRPNAGEVPDAQQDRQVGPQIASAIEPAVEHRLRADDGSAGNRARPAAFVRIARAQSCDDPLQTLGGKRATALGRFGPS